MIKWTIRIYALLSDAKNLRATLLPISIIASRQSSYNYTILIIILFILLFRNITISESFVRVILKQASLKRVPIYTSGPVRRITNKMRRRYSHASRRTMIWILTRAFPPVAGSETVLFHRGYGYVNKNESLDRPMKYGQRATWIVNLTTQ